METLSQVCRDKTEDQFVRSFGTKTLGCTLNNLLVLHAAALDLFPSNLSTSLLQDYLMCFVGSQSLVERHNLTLSLIREVVGLTQVIEVGGQTVTWPEILVLRGGAGGGGGGVRRWRRLSRYWYCFWGQWRQHWVKYWHGIEVFVKVLLETETVFNLLQISTIINFKI